MVRGDFIYDILVSNNIFRKQRRPDFDRDALRSRPALKRVCDMLLKTLLLTKILYI